MKVKMIKTAKGSIDGVNVKDFIEGQEYDLSGDLLKCFVEMGVVVESTPETVLEKAVIENALETKPVKMRGRK